MTVVYEEEFQKDNVINRQDRYVIVPDWETYRGYLLGDEVSCPSVRLPGDTLLKREYTVMRDDPGKISIQFKLPNSKIDALYIHNAQIVKTRMIYNALVVIPEDSADAI